MSLRTGRILVVEADRAIGAKIIGVSRLGRMQALNSIHPPACSYLSLSVQHEINLFCHFVMMRKVGPARLEVHQEKVGDGIGGVDPVTHARVRPDEKLILHRLDRKSTRLNSSHDQISYAVFCLKKKKKIK